MRCLRINTDKTSQKVTKYPRRQERGKKSYETHMKRIKGKILEELSTPSPTDKPIPSTPSPTGNSTPSTSSSTNTYAYGVDILAVFAVGVCVFFAYSNSQAANNKQVNKKRQKQQQQSKRRRMI